MSGSNLPADPSASPESSVFTETDAYVEISTSLSSDRLKIGDIASERYRILSLIGRGGMGSVYKVEQIFLRKELALKTLNTHSVTELTIRRFQHEARAIFGIDHPNLISVHDFGLLDEKVPFLVMDYVDGRSLSTILRTQGTLSVQEAVPIFLRICFGLGYAHEQGVVHRDIKPSNIMLVNGLKPQDNGSVKIVDFGIAKFSQTEATDVQALTKTGEVFGSPLYMSPEQCVGTPVDLRADVYSLGCVFFEALTGTTPFVGANALSTMMQHLGETAPSMKEASMGKAFPPALEQIIAKMLAKNPAERYQKLSHVAGDLAALERTLEDPIKLANARFVEHSMMPAVKKPERKTEVGERKTCSISPSNSDPSRSDSVSDAHAMTGSESRLQTGSHAVFRRPSVLLSIALSVSCLVGITAAVSSYVTIRLQENGSEIQKSKGGDETAEDGRFRRLSETKQVAKTLIFNSGQLDVSDKAITESLNRQRHLGKRKLHYIRIGDFAWNALMKERFMTALDISGCLLDNERLIEIAELPALTEMTVSRTNLDDVGAAGIAQSTRLKKLEANMTNLTANAIPYFAAMPSLEILEIEGTSLTPQSIRILSGKKSLISLGLRSVTGLKDDDMARFVQSNLYFLNIEGSALGDETAEYLSQMRNLQGVAIGFSKISQVGLETLMQSRTIKTIKCFPSDVLSERDIDRLARKYPGCRVVKQLQVGDDFDYVKLRSSAAWMNDKKTD